MSWRRPASAPRRRRSLRLEELTGEDWVREDTAERVRGGYSFRQNRFSAWLDGEDDGAIEAALARLPAAEA